MHWIDDDIGFFPGAVNIGVVRDDRLVYVDAGIDNSAVNKVMKNVGRPDAAVITHHHADHMGGCNKLEKLGVVIHVPPGEKELFTNPLIEPYSMFGGALPPKTLRNRHLEARAITQFQLTNPGFTAISTPGHTLDHMAYKFGDVIYAGDAVFTQETIEKYKLLFAISPMQASMAIDYLDTLQFSSMVVAHGPLLEGREEAKAAMAATKEHYVSLRERILEVIGEALPFDQYLTTLISELGVTDIVRSRGFTQYVLYQVPLFGYLSNLLDDKIVTISTEQGLPKIMAT